MDSDSERRDAVDAVLFTNGEPEDEEADGLLAQYRILVEPPKPWFRGARE